MYDAQTGCQNVKTFYSITYYAEAFYIIIIWIVQQNYFQPFLYLAKLLDTSTKNRSFHVCFVEFLPVA